MNYWIVDINGVERPVGPIKSYEEAITLQYQYIRFRGIAHNIINDEIKELIYQDELDYRYDELMLEYSEYGDI